MTTYLWDASHFDGTLTKATLAKAKAEGIDGFTHKLGEGANHNDDDHTQTTALTAARDAGIQVIGGYWFGHNDDDPIVTAGLCVQVADQYEPWWRAFPGWFWQADCETETGEGKPSRDWIQKFCDRLVSLTGRKVIVYASHGEYGNSLAGLTHPLWNANYPSSRKAPFRNLYPGDSFAGWKSYSGQTPVICQYTSSATIAGRTTCDANAFRGSVADLIALITPPHDDTEEDMLTTADIAAIWSYKPGWPNLRDETPLGMLNDAANSGGAVAKAIAGLPAAVAAAIPAGVSLTGAQVGQIVHEQMTKLNLVVTP